MTDPTLLLVKLRWEQSRLLSTVDAFQAFVANPQPGPFEQLIALRRAWVRDMLLHFAHVEERVLQPLMGDRREQVATIAARSSQDLVNTYRQFQRHAQTWYGDAPLTQWCAYREAMGLLIRRIRVRLAAQESDLYPLLPLQPGTGRIAPMVEPVDYAAEAVQMQRLAYAQRSAEDTRVRLAG